jgi:hypothetical protein
LALIGLFNVLGTYAAGVHWGSVWPKRYILAFIYLARAVAITRFFTGAADHRHSGLSCFPA